MVPWLRSTMTYVLYVQSILRDDIMVRTGTGRQAGSSQKGQGGEATSFGVFSNGGDLVDVVDHKLWAGLEEVCHDRVVAPFQQLGKGDGGIRGRNHLGVPQSHLADQDDAFLNGLSVGVCGGLCEVDSSSKGALAPTVHLLGSDDGLGCIRRSLVIESAAPCWLQPPLPTLVNVL